MSKLYLTRVDHITLMSSLYLARIDHMSHGIDDHDLNVDSQTKFVILRAIFDMIYHTATA